MAAARQLKTFLVVNPFSGNGATGRSFERIARAVREAIGSFEHVFTERPMHAVELAREALKAGFECVVAVGGDGTLNEVVNGFFEHGKPVREGAVVGLLPRGTGGDFRRNFGWSRDLDEAAARLKGDASRAIDLGRIDFVDNDGRPTERWFANIASAGVSGEVDREVNRTTKVLGGTVSFGIGTVRALARYRDRLVRYTLDGGREREIRATVIAVANGGWFGGGMWVAPDAQVDDGTFEVTVWDGYRLHDFALRGRALYNGAHVRFANTSCARARTVRMDSDETVLLDIDGEQPGRLPALIEIVPGAIRVKV